MYGYFRLQSETENFSLLVPARWHWQSTFQWLRNMQLCGLNPVPDYKMIVRVAAERGF